MKVKNTIVFIYHSFKDPLFQNLILKYLNTLSAKAEYNFYLITFEQEKYKIEKKERRKIKEGLKAKRIFWYPVTYHSGRFILIKKIYDFIIAFGLVAWLKLQKKTRLIFAFTNISAAFSVVFAKLFYMQSLVYCYEPHSDYLVELGIWQKGFKYKIFNKLEKYAGVHSNYILATTKFVVELLKEWNSKAEIYRLPVSVDENDFKYKPEGRNCIRRKYNIENKQVLLYIGKFGYLYYDKEIAVLCKTIYELNFNFFFLIVTSNDNKEIKNIFVQEGLSEKDFLITGNLTYDEVKDYISAADIGLSAVPPSSSQKYRSPTKTAEYLLCGLPYITCKGISEDDIIANQYNVGVVVDSFERNSVAVKMDQINLLVQEDKEKQRIRCREVGEKYRGKANVDKILKELFEKIFKQ